VGAQYTDLPPPPRRQAITWTASRFLGLQDALRTIAGASYDLAPGQRPPLMPDLRTWIAFEPLSLFVFPRPQGAILTELPPPPRRQAVTWIDKRFLGLTDTTLTAGGEQFFALPPRPKPFPLHARSVRPPLPRPVPVPPPRA